MTDGTLEWAIGLSGQKAPHQAFVIFTKDWFLNFVNNPPSWNIDLLDRCKSISCPSLLSRGFTWTHCLNRHTSHWKAHLLLLHPRSLMVLGRRSGFLLGPGRTVKLLEGISSSFFVPKSWRGKNWARLSDWPWSWLPGSRSGFQWQGGDVFTGACYAKETLWFQIMSEELLMNVYYAENEECDLSRYPKSQVLSVTI